jgi:hypothetical protein
MSPDNLASNPVGGTLAWAALVALVAAVAVFTWLDAKKPIKDGLQEYFSTDTTFNYKPARLFGMLRKYHDQADDRDRQKYFDAHRYFIKVDFVFALVYTVASIILILYLSGALSPPFPSWLRHLWLIPLVVGVCDILEGFTMWRVLEDYRGGLPVSPPTITARLSSALTSVKIIFMYPLGGLLLVGAVAFLLKKLGRL